MIKRVLLCLAAVLLSAAFCCCREENRISDPETGGGIGWPERSVKENCVELLEMTLSHSAPEKYRELLLKPDTSGTFPEGYRWINNAAEPDSELPPSIDYHMDIDAVSRVISHAEEMELEIEGGNLYSESYFRGKRCDNCWSTIREYRLMAMMDNNKTYYGYFRISVFIGPDPDESGKYLIYQATDLPAPTAGSGKFPAGVEDTSLGELKHFYREFP
ncbi:MAG: hypothetical protein GF417_06650 [Candidatus Latescibacteria bacterium]|nr:hypothetical protein [bacterium]MBD3424097.1 hypothetical protein [Candidatus Latescibacterota bacterium]